MLSQAPTVEGAAALGRNAMAATSKIAEAALSGSANGLACRAGCAHCCYQAVGVSPPEALAIHEHLLATRSTEELDALDRRLRDADEKTRGMGLTERLSPELPCPFLEEGACSIYEVRPLACRGKNSLDAAACERTLHDAEARRAFIAGKLAVPCYREPIRAFHAVAAGLQLALEELHRLHAEPLELTAAMRLLRGDPEGVPRRWLAGEDPFEPARGGDTSDDPRIRELSGRR
jgi:Fe-S-cluster containining protein